MNLFGFLACPVHTAQVVNEVCPCDMVYNENLVVPTHYNDMVAMCNYMLHYNDMLAMCNYMTHYTDNLAVVEYIYIDLHEEFLQDWHRALYPVCLCVVYHDSVVQRVFMAHFAHTTTLLLLRSQRPLTN